MAKLVGSVSTAVYLLLLTIVGLVGAWWLFVPMVAVLVAIVASIPALYIGAKYNMWFTFVKEGTIKTVVAGQNFVRFIPNINGYHYDPITHEIKEGDEEESWFTKQTGLYLVSWVYPIRSIFTFDVPAIKLKENRGRIEKIEDKIEIYKKPHVDHLLWKIDRPFLLLNVDLADGTRVHIIGTGIYTVCNPYRLLFELDAKFFNNLDTLQSGYTINKLKQVTIENLRTNRDQIIKVEELTGIYDIKEIVGLTPVSVVIEEWSISEEDQAIQTAIQQQRIETERAAALRIKGDAEKAYRTALKEGDAAGDRAFVDVLRGAGLTGDEIAEIFANREMKELKGTYVKGSGPDKTRIVIPAKPSPGE